MTRGDFLRHLRKSGCTLDREGGSHEWYVHPDGGQSAVPRGSKEIGPGLARKICGELGIKPPAGR